MALPLLKNPKVLASFIENSERILTPLFADLFEEVLKDGSIKSEQNPQMLASLFVFIANIWLSPAVMPCTKKVLIEKLTFAQETFDKLGVPIIDDEIVTMAKTNAEQLTIE